MFKGFEIGSLSFTYFYNFPRLFFNYQVKFGIQSKMNAIYLVDK